MSKEVDSIVSAFSFISERGVLSGIYLGSFCFGLVLSNDQFTSDVYSWLAGICFLIGLILSNITYEFLLTPYRWFTEPVAVKSFHKTVQLDSAKTEIKNYQDLRKFRERFLVSTDSPERLKNSILKDEKLRQTLTYISSSSILILIGLIAASQDINFSKETIRLETWIALYVLIATLLGEISRSASIGRFLGFSYLHHVKEGKNENSSLKKFHEEKDKPILCLDFDGVLHWYRKGWKSATIIDDIPVPGAKEFVTESIKHFDVVIFSSRCHYPGGITAIHDWLKNNGFPEIDVIAEKPSAHVVIDDRAFQFSGEWPDIKKLIEFKPWNKRKKAEQTA